MIDNVAVSGGNMELSLQARALGYLKELEAAIRTEADARRIPPGLVEALRPCNTLCAVSDRYMYVVFTAKNAGQVPLQAWLDGRGREIGNEPNPASALNVAVGRHGFEDPKVFYVDVAQLDFVGDERQSALKEEAKGCMDIVERILKRTIALGGYEYLQSTLDAFSSDHAKFECNVFLAMRFRQTEQFEQIDTALRTSLRQYGLEAHRADDKMYSADGDLWHNVCVYMMGCRYAVCVFEEIDERKFNPNVAIELGFLRAMNRQLLLLKEQRVPLMPTDMSGKLYRTFDSYRIGASIPEQIGFWAERDLGLARLSP